MRIHRQRARVKPFRVSTVRIFSHSWRIHRNSGVALITVLGVLSMVMVLIVAMLSQARSEFVGSRLFSDINRTRQAKDTALNFFIGQVRKGTGADVQNPVIWASQPGAIRQYSPDGTFALAAKLYTSDQMIHSGREAALLEDLPPNDWRELPTRYTDLNEPIVRDGRTLFPILDPRAHQDGGSGEGDVEGFSYSATTPGGDAIAGTIVPGRGSGPEDLRVPMPVMWIYQLQDGTLGTLDDSNEFIGPRAPTDDNPIVARFAFWADDESSKINVNTASEPTYFATPMVMRGGATPEDTEWAFSQPATGEYQRFPGHPAGVALSPVIFPNQPTIDATTKGVIYDMAPKLENAGTESGTKRVHQVPTPYNTNRALAERLYASTDEFIFQEDRKENPLDLAGSLRNVDILSRSKFFLTSHSRAPEYTSLGTPRISVWPVDGRGEGYRTPFDNLIARVSTLGDAHAYHFTRESSNSPTHDISLPRNEELLGYLSGLAGRNTGYPATFAGKNLGDSEQILTEVFDYIRNTNLCDARLDDAIPNLTGAEGTYPKILKNIPGNHKTFTPGRFNEANNYGYHNYGFGYFPGHGQSVPSRRGDHTGFGRYYTLAEVSSVFIACAAGAPNNVNPYRNDDSIPEKWRGGYACPDWDNSRIFYSNFPPNPQGDPYGPDQDHPGYNEINWNWALENNTPLEPDTVRVQSTIIMDWFCTTSGYTIIRGNFGVRVRGLSNLSLNGESLYPDDVVTIKPYWDIADTYHGGYRGSSDSDPRGMLRKRKCPARGNHPADRGYDDSGLPAPDNDASNYDLISNYVDVKVGQPMEFTASGPVTIELYNFDGMDSEPLQTFEIRFPNRTETPVPLMAETYPHPTNTWAESYGSTYWSFHADGYNAGASTSGWENVGRLHDTIHVFNRGHGSIYRPYSDVICSMVPWHGDYRLIAAQRNVGEDTTSPWTEAGASWEFVPHIGFPSASSRGSHNIDCRYNWWAGYSGGNANTRIFPGAWGGGYQIRFPNTEEASELSKRYGDFDDAPGNTIGGALVNKPDEGNYYSADGTNIPYFQRDWMFEEGQKVDGRPAFFSPNRIIPSPAMMGSLPSGVVRRDPWRTLLFRPQSSTSYGSPHPGAAAEFGGEDPPDHVLLDWFQMPVVEPYALTDATSTAGKINLNYQILPFQNIRRATGMHALLKEEMLTKIQSNMHGWRIKMDVPATLGEFDEKFDQGELFRLASQICEMHLIPITDAGTGDPAGFKDASKPVTERMDAFWDYFRGTADNLREQPYANLYSRLTTRTNTWTIHIRAQAIHKARSAPPDAFDPARDSIGAEYRGSAVIERFINPEDPSLPDYATESEAPSLDTFHQFRILSERRFGS